jgi:hypothetical protein
LMIWPSDLKARKAGFVSAIELKDIKWAWLCANNKQTNERRLLLLFFSVFMLCTIHWQSKM